MGNRDVEMSLEDGVLEVLSILTGLDLHYDPEQDRFRAVARAINRAMRAVALEQEWGHYASTEEVGSVVAGMQRVELNTKIRPRIVNDDAVRLVNDDGQVVMWAYFLPRDALHKYGTRRGLWVSVTRSTLEFSRPLWEGITGLRIVVPVMREPVMFRIPKDGETMSEAVLNQKIDFDYPDLVIAKAAELYASSDPVMQPRVQSLQASYKDLMYQLMERDERMTDTPYANDFVLPIRSSLHDGPDWHGGHPHSDGAW